MPQPWEDVSAAGRWLRALADEVDASVVHLNEPVLAALEWSAPTLVVAHSCVLSWWEAVLGEPAPPAWDRYREAMRAGLAAAQGVVAPSRAMLGAVRRHYGVRHGRAIPNGREPAGLQPETKHAYVLTAGRLWDRAKNAGALDRAAAGLAWPVYAAGPSASPDGNTVSLTHVSPLGHLDPRRLAGWMARAAIFALPARYEPFGLSVLEAALAGCALVLGDIPSLREHWDGIAVFVPPDDAELLRVALTSLIEDPQLRHTLAMRARRRALGFSARRMARAYLTEYDAILAGREAACAS
jgi:glycosyltransferase involved in cell wall biosynthesis